MIVTLASATKILKVPFIFQNVPAIGEAFEGKQKMWNAFHHRIKK